MRNIFNELNYEDMSVIETYRMIVKTCSNLSLLDSESQEILRGEVIKQAAKHDDQDSRALRCFEQIIRIYQEE